MQVAKILHEPDVEKEVEGVFPNIRPESRHINNTSSFFGKTIIYAVFRKENVIFVSIISI